MIVKFSALFFCLQKFEFHWFHECCYLLIHRCLVRILELGVFIYLLPIQSLFLVDLLRKKHYFFLFETQTSARCRSEETWTVRFEMAASFIFLSDNFN